MRFHHMCIVTTDLEGSIKLWRDVLGFTVNVEMELPDGPEPGPTVFANAKLMNDAFEIHFIALPPGDAQIYQKRLTASRCASALALGLVARGDFFC